MMQLAEDKKQKIFDKSLGAIKHWLERFDTIIIGPGLGRDEMVHHVVIEVSPQSVKFTFSAGRCGLIVLACSLQAYIAAHTFVVPCSCYLTEVIMITSSHLLWIKNPTGWCRKL